MSSKTILPSNTKKARNIVIYERLKAGEKALDLARVEGYPRSTQAIYKIRNRVQRWIDQGLLEEMESPYGK